MTYQPYPFISNSSGSYCSTLLRVLPTDIAPLTFRRNYIVRLIADLGLVLVTRRMWYTIFQQLKRLLKIIQSSLILENTSGSLAASSICISFLCMSRPRIWTTIFVSFNSFYTFNKLLIHQKPPTSFASIHVLCDLTPHKSKHSLSLTNLIIKFSVWRMFTMCGLQEQHLNSFS
jgi:hypothetical protein